MSTGENTGRLETAYPNAATISEVRQGDFLDTTAQLAACNAPVMHDLALTYVDSVMHISAPRRNHLCTHRRSSPTSKSLSTPGYRELPRSRRERRSERPRRPMPVVRAGLDEDSSTSQMANTSGISITTAPGHQALDTGLSRYRDRRPLAGSGAGARSWARRGRAPARMSCVFPPPYGRTLSTGRRNCLHRCGWSVNPHFREISLKGALLVIIQ